MSPLLADKLRTLVAGESGLTEKRMFGGVAFLINGNMSCGLTNDDNIVVRVGPDAYDDALAEPGCRPMDFTGRPMRGWVYIDQSACSNDKALARWLHRGIDFARSLPRK